MFVPGHARRPTLEEQRSCRRAADPACRRIHDELIAARLRAWMTQQQFANRLCVT
jgi:hypothetical protein